MDKRSIGAPQGQWCWVMLLLLGLLWTLTSCAPLQPAHDAVATPVAPRLTEPLGVLTYIAGEVYVDPPQAQSHPAGLLALIPPSAPTPNAATPYQALPQGATVRTGPQGGATIVCANNYVCQVPPSSSVTVTPNYCASGKPLKPGAVQAAQPGAAGFKVIQGSRVSEGELQGEGERYGQQPVLVTPRLGRLWTPPTTLAWVEVTGATQYQVELRQSGAEPLLLNAGDAAQIACAEQAALTPLRFCSIPWPPAWPLKAGPLYTLRISAYTNQAGDKRTSEVGAFTLATPSTQLTLTQTLVDLQALKLDAVTEQLLWAGHLAGAGFFNDALAIYNHIAAQQPAPIVDVTRGELYRQGQLWPFALWAYQQALQAEVPNAGLQASAEWGIGQVYFSQRQYRAAEIHLMAADQLYAQTVFAEARAAVQALLKKVRERL